tara:strand:+ start:225 stop:392 length:168 start_codon:yes stop_codon:yes gene_type:complete
MRLISKLVYYPFCFLAAFIWNIYRRVYPEKARLMEEETIEMVSLTHPGISWERPE